MVYAAAILALIGFATGLWFRLRFLLAILALLLLLSIFFSISSGFGFLDTALTIMAAQTITQAGYFLGLVARAFFTANGVRHIL
ncbi:hypothetical protein [Bradyrhizobium australiense]|uniref:Uncharacterized protein n=1 Tax=Bradyrhizobium australiense TaxID=2721161 RepID=A0A7Y4GXC1_9BRAD|nr:hypothetical protein [Bradyrhizobium australiense]NOJ43686.1 hypothetical protein [Bradyrhizobium australiense]